MTIHPTPQNSPASREGFTLIELLVVISIIAILVSVVIPISKLVTDSGNSTRSMANLRNIGTALKSYAAENDNKFPVVESDAPLDWSDATVDLPIEDLERLPYWVRAVIHHAALSDADLSNRVFSCPGLGWKDTEGKKLKTEDILLAYGCTEAMYGFDGEGERMPTEARSTATIENKSNTILVVETKQQGSEPLSYGDVSWRDARRDFDRPSPADSNKVDFRFGKATNCLMVDGSTIKYRQKDNRDLEEPHWTGEDYDSIRNNGR